ncbi:hypothetical protein D3C87_1725700 [compost metagenome]
MAQLPSRVIRIPVSAICLMTVPVAEREKWRGDMVVNALAFRLVRKIEAANRVASIITFKLAWTLSG